MTPAEKRLLKEFKQDIQESKELIIQEVRSLRNLQELTLRTLATNNRQEINMAKTSAEYLSEIGQLQTTLVQKVEAQGTLIGGMEEAVNGMVAIIAALKQQISDLLAAGGDPSLLQPLLDSAQLALTGLEANSARIAAAQLAGTPQGV